MRKNFVKLEDGVVRNGGDGEEEEEEEDKTTEI